MADLPSLFARKCSLSWHSELGYCPAQSYIQVDIGAPSSFSSSSSSYSIVARPIFGPLPPRCRGLKTVEFFRAEDDIQVYCLVRILTEFTTKCTQRNREAVGGDDDERRNYVSLSNIVWMISFSETARCHVSVGCGIIILTTVRISYLTRYGINFLQCTCQCFNCWVSERIDTDFPSPISLVAIYPTPFSVHSSFASGYRRSHFSVLAPVRCGRGGVCSVGGVGDRAPAMTILLLTQLQSSTQNQSVVDREVLITIC